LGHLSGAGVAFYLALALKRRLSEVGKLSADFDPKVLLDFFTIGTLTDMVPLVRENRALVRHGLRQLAETRRPGLRRLLQELRMDGRELSSQDVAVQFAPKLNALSRMEIGLLPVDLFFVEDEEKADEMVGTVSANNKKRKDLQAFAESWAVRVAEGCVEKGFTFVHSDKFHKGVIGLVATRLCQRYGVPAFVGSVSGEEIVGSARAPDRSGVNLLEVFEPAKDLLDRFGGHAKAAGFVLPLARAEAFEERLAGYFKNRAVSPLELEYDVEVDFSEIDKKFVDMQSRLEPFGQGFPQPRYRIRGNLLSEKIMTGGHKKWQATDGERRLELVYFSPPATEAFRPGPFEALVRLQKNYFQGRESVQILVDDLRSFG
jgi:single-stranded-DNA-specific exonuclease